MSKVATEPLPAPYVDVDGRHHFPTGRIGLADHTDVSLARCIRDLTRAIEDGSNVAFSTRLLVKARGQKLARFALRVRYGAVDNDQGTNSYDAHYRLNQAPTYRLAAQMDRWNAANGRRHVLGWDA